MGWDKVGAGGKCDGGCGWSRTLVDIAEMLDDADYLYAEDFLVEIEGWIKKNKHVTPKQKVAVHNIWAKPGQPTFKTYERGDWQDW